MDGMTHVTGSTWDVLVAQQLEKFGVDMPWQQLLKLAKRAREMVAAGYDHEEIQKEIGLYGGLAAESMQQLKDAGYTID